MSQINKKTEFETKKNKFTSIGGILELLSSLFKSPKTPLTPLPPPLLLIGAQLRPGIVYSEIASRIIARQSESGAVVGNVFADGNNVAEMMETIRIEEILYSLLNESKIEIVIPPGIPVTTIGASPTGGIVVSQGVTTLLATGWGVIR